MEDTEVIEQPEAEVSDREALDEAGDKAFDRLNAPESEQKEPAQPEKTEPAPADKGEDDKFAWLKSLDEKTLADIKAGHILPKHRFDEVNQRLQGYAAFGSPEELKRKLDELMRRPEKPAEPVKEPQTPEDQAKDNEAKEYLTRLFPFLKDFPQKLEQMTEFMRSTQEQSEAQEAKATQEHNDWIAKGEGEVKRLAAEAGINVKDEKTLARITRAVVSCLHDDDALADQFYRGRSIEAIKTAFDEFKKTFLSGSEIKAAAQILNSKKLENKLPKPPAAGAAPEPEKPKSTADMNDAEFEEHINARLADHAAGRSLS